MNIVEILDYVRIEILDDTVGPNYLWPDKQLVRHLNRAYEELCRESECLIDNSTAAVCQIPLLSNQGEYAYHAKILKIFDMRRSSDGGWILPKTEEYMYGYTNWRSQTGTIPIFRIMNLRNRYFTIYPKYDTVGYVAGSSDISFAQATKIISRAGEDFTAHYASGDSIVVDGTTNNDGTFTIVTVAATAITVSEALVNESNTSATIQKVEDTALLRVTRLPITSWTEADLLVGTATPEIDVTYHMGLSDGVAKYAFGKQDTQTYDPRKAADHAKKFEDFKSDVKWDILRLMEGDAIMSPHYGAL